MASLTHLNRFLLNGMARRIPEGKNYSAADTVLQILWGYIDRVTRYTGFAEMSRVNVLYRSVVPKVMSGKWKGV